MNLKFYILILYISVVILPSCQKREWNNPFDPDCPKVSFTPGNFKAEQQGNVVKLTWTQSNNQISGFKIERKVAGGSWAEVTATGKSITTWNDIDLTGGKLHEYRLYAFAGSNLSNVVSAQITPLFTGIITTAAISNITSSSATSGGSISSDGGAPITARGVCWGTSQSPTIAGSRTTDGTGTGTFTSAITGLTAGTTYYVRAYATNSVGTAYGSQVSFITSQAPSLPIVTTASVTTFSSTNAVMGGIVTSDGNGTVTDRGVCFSTSQNPTTANNKTAIGSGTGVFSTTVTGLSANTTYYVRAYAVNSQGTAYGAQVSFTTNTELSIPTVTTNSVTTYTSTTALLGGNVNNDGNATVTERGVCYSTSQNPTTENNKTVIGSGTGTFSTTVSGLSANTTYYVRAYAINSLGTAYGSQVIVLTPGELPTVITTPVTVIPYPLSITTGGTITNSGSSPVTSRGVCWSMVHPPTIDDPKTTDGSGTGSFTSKITGVSGFVYCYVRAYATNSFGTAYGNQLTFTTPSVILSIGTSAVASITSVTAKSGGLITIVEGIKVSAYGICWNTLPSPTLSDYKTDEGTLTGSFSGSFVSALTGLKPKTTYYVRAYMIWNEGTVYGSEVTFTTNESSQNTLTDIDGNSYNTIIIGEQTWMAENLKTTKYNDGSAIPNVTENSGWLGLTTGAYCWYDNNSLNKSTYGALYNWFAVYSGKICPTGWHVPSDAEWKKLSDYLINNDYGYGGISNSIAKPLAAISNWAESPVPGTPGNDLSSNNSSGFSGLPGGIRQNDGKFNDIGIQGHWWSGSERSTAYFWSWYLFNNSPNLLQTYKRGDYGLSIRCIKD